MSLANINIFLKNKDNYDKITDSNQTKLIDVLADDEIWLVQCPKSLDISAIKDNKIKLPGKTNIKQLESIAEECNTPTTFSFIMPGENGELDLKQLKVQGTIVFRKQTDVAINEDNYSTNIKSRFRIPFPDIKERHPLFGVHYKQRTNLKKSIKNLLKEADIPRKQIKIENFYDKSEIEEEKLERNHKRKQKSNESDHIVKRNHNMKSKKVKIEFDEDEKSLSWLRNI